MRTLFLLCTLCAAGVFGSGSGAIVSSIVCSVYPCYKGARPQTKAPPARIDTTITHRVTFNINQGNRYMGRIVLGLYGRVAPKTVKNFYEIASGRHPKKYAGTVFHRVIQNFMLQGGDVEHKNGVGSWSIYGSRFEDENFLLKHDEPFTLSMANAGKDTNGSQFFITTVVTPWLDGKHTVFGKVLDGQSVVKDIERVPTDHHDKPVTPVYISSVQVEEVAPTQV